MGVETLLDNGMTLQFMFYLLFSEYSRCSFSMMVKWANDGLLQANDGKMLVNDGEMLVNDGELSVDHSLISPSLSSISPSLA